MPTMPTESEFWEKRIDEVNRLHAELQKKPDHLKKGYALAPAGILNAYREGDLSFDEAVKFLQISEEVIGEVTEWAGLPAELILKALKILKDRLSVLCTVNYKDPIIWATPMKELNEILKKLEEAIDGEIGADQEPG